jgi:hypothetical protein
MLYISNVEKPYSGEDRVECSVCLDNDMFTYKSWIILISCKHAFHRHCIDIWMEKSDECPLCKTKISVLPQVQIEIPSEVVINNPENGNVRGLLCIKYFVFIFCMSIILIPLGLIVYYKT